MQRVPSAGRSVRSEGGSWSARGLVADHQGCPVGWGSPSSGVPPPPSPTRPFCLFPVLCPLPFPLGTHTSFSFCFSRVSSPMKKPKVRRTLRMSCLKHKVKPGLVVGATFGQCWAARQRATSQGQFPGKCPVWVVSLGGPSPGGRVPALGDP